MSRVADPFLAQAEALLAVEDDPFLSQAEALLSEDTPQPTGIPGMPGSRAQVVPQQYDSMGTINDALQGTIAGDVLTGLNRGIPALKGQVSGAMGMAGGVIPGAIGDRLNRYSSSGVAQAQGELNAMPPTTTFAGGIAEAVPGVAASVAAGVLGGPAAGIAFGGLQQGGAVYNDSMERLNGYDANGVVNPAAQQVATVQALPAAAISAATGAIPMGRVLGRLTGKFTPGVIDKAASRVLGTRVGRIIADAAIEGSQEAGDELTQMVLQRIAEDDNTAFDGGMKRLGMAAAGGAVLGPLTTGTADIAGRIAGAPRQNNTVGQTQNVPGTDGNVPVGGQPVQTDASTMVREGDAAQPAPTPAITNVDPAGAVAGPDVEAMTEEELAAALLAMDGEQSNASNPESAPTVQNTPTYQSPDPESTAWFIPPEQARRMEQVRQTQSATNTNDSATLRPSEPSTSPESLGIGNDQPTTLTEPTSSPVAQEDDATKNPELSNQDTSNPPQDVAQGVASTSNPIPDDVARYIRGMDNVELMLVRDSVKSGKPPTNEDYRPLVEELSPYIETVLSELSRRYDASPTNLTPQGVASVRGLGKSDPTLQEGEGKPPPQMNVPEIRRVPGEPVLGGEPRTRFQEGVADALPAAAATGANQTTFSRSQSSPNSTPDLAELSKRSGAAVTLADSAKLTETERSVTKRLGSLGRSVVWVDTDGPARGAVVGRTPTTIYLRRGMGSVRLAPIALHEVMHSARRTNPELASQLVDTFGRDKVLARGREELGLQAEAGVDVAGSEDAAIDEGLAGLLEDAANENADLRQRIIETPGLLDRLRVWLKQTLANLAGKGSQEVRHAMKLLDQLEAQARKESNSRAEKSIDWARSQSGVKRKIDDAYNSGSAKAYRGEYDTQEALNDSDSMTSRGQYSNADYFRFAGPFPDWLIEHFDGGRAELKRRGFQENHENGKAEEAFDDNEDLAWRIVEANDQVGSGKRGQRSRTDALRKAQEPEARFVAAYSDLLGGKPPTKPKAAARVSELQGGDIVRIEGQASRVVEEGGYLSLKGGAFDGLSIEGMDAIPVDSPRGWWRADSGTAEPADAPKEETADIPFSARKLPNTINVDGKQRSTLNSDGKPIAPTEEAVRAFWKWFGDSKVVDAEGRPLVVYKAMYPYDTNEGKPITSINRPSEFPAFNRGETGVRVAGFFGDKKTANRFADSLGGMQAVFPTYLKFEQPSTIDANGNNAGDMQFGQSGKPFRDAIRSGKFDSIVLRNTKDEGTVYVALKPSQIKSATGNQGTFNKDNADIRFSARKIPDTINVDGKQRSTLNSDGKPIAPTEEAVRAFWKWFGDSKVVDAEGRPLVVYHGTGVEFNEFRPSDGIAGAGMYFSSSPKGAETYASIRGKTPNIKPAFLSITNPANHDQVVKAVSETHAGDAAVRLLVSRGFDGATYPQGGEDDGAGGWSRYKTFVAYKPSQIKSATGNQGTFSKDNADIRFSARKLELKSEEQQGMLGFTSGWAAPKKSKEPPLSAKEKAELYPGIRQGETVSQYNKRMGTSDTPSMFEDAPDRELKQRPGEFDDAYTSRLAEAHARKVVDEPQSASLKDISRAMGYLSRLRAGLVARGMDGAIDKDAARQRIAAIDREWDILKFWRKQKESGTSDTPVMFSARNQANIETVVAAGRSHILIASPSRRDLRFLWRSLDEYPNAPRGTKMVRYVIDEKTDVLYVHDGRLLHDDLLKAKKSLNKGWYGSGWLYADGTIDDYMGENDALIRKGVGKESDIRFSARLPDTIEVNGKQRPTTNSDGKPIARTAEEVRNFWKWFGDSKVVDKDGKPLVVYHGSPENFTIFDSGKIGETNGRSEGAGFYFTTNKKIADGYAKRAGDGTLYEVYLSISKPLDYTAKGFSKPQLQRLLLDAAKREAIETESTIEDGFLANYGDTYGDGVNAAVREAAALIASDETAVDQLGGVVGSGVSPKVVNESLKAVLGYDGFVSQGFSNAGTQAGGVIWVAALPTQIKSATGNRGTFDASEADIRFSAGKQSNFAKENARDATTITKLSRQATEATQNLEAEKAKTKAIDSANRMRANMEVRIAKVAMREAARLKDRTAQVIEKKAAEVVTLSQKREAERQAAKQTIADLKNSARSLLGLLAKGDKAYNASQAKLSDADAKNWITGQKAKWTAEATDQLRKAVHTLIRKDSESAKTILSKLTQAKTPGEIYNLAREVERYAAFDDARRLQRRLVGFLGVGDITRLSDPKVRDKIVTKGALEVLSGLDGQRDEAKYAMSTIIDLGAEFDRLYRAGEPAAGLRQTLDEMNAMFSRLVQLKHEAKLADKIVKNGRLSNVYDTVKVDEPAIKAAPVRLVGKFGRHARSLKPWLTRQVLNVPTLVRVVTGGKGAIHQTITEGLAKGTSDAFNIKRKAFAEADAAAKAAGYVDLRDALAKISGSLGEASQKTITLSTPLNGTTEISLDQAMKIAAIDPETLDDMLTRDRRFNWSTNLGGNGDTLTWDTYSEIRDKVGPEHLKLIDTLKDIRDDRFEPMARVVKALTGVEPPKVIGYEPRRVNQEYLKAKRGAEPNANMNATTFTNSMLQNMGLTKARESKAAPLVMHGFLQDWVASIDEVSRITAMAETVHNAHTMLRVESVKNAIDERWGTEVLNDIHRRIDTVAGVEATDQRMKKVTRVVKFLSRNVGRSLTAVNVKSWLRTTGGVFPLAAEMPRAWFVRGVKDAFTTKGLWDEALANSPILDEQFGQSPVGLAGAGEAMTGLQPKATAKSVGRSAAALGKSVKSAAVNAANFRVDTFADIRDIFDKGLPNLMDHIRVLNFFASLPARIAYAGNKARYGGDIQRAVRETERVIRETQGMNDPLYRSGWQHTIMGGPLAPLAMFSNDGSRMLNQLVNAKLDGKPGKVIAAILLNSAWGGLIVMGLSKAMINALLNDDDDEANTEQALRDGAFTAVRDTAGLVPGADRLVETVWAAVDKGRRGAPSDAALSTPVGSLLSDTVDATTKLFGDGVTALGDDAKAQRAEDRFWKNLESLGLNASSVAGVPLAPGYRLVKNVAGAAAK